MWKDVTLLRTAVWQYISYFRKIQFDFVKFYYISISSDNIYNYLIYLAYRISTVFFFTIK